MQIRRLFMNKRKKQSNDQNIDDSWLLPYADMLTLLLALFIILFSMSQLDATKYEKLTNIFKTEFTSDKIALDVTENPDMASDQEREEKEEVTDETYEQLAELSHLKGLQEEIDHYILDNDLVDILGTKLSDEGLLITIYTDVSFASGSATVNDEGRKVAKEISQFLQTDPPHEIVISGHADDRPIYNADFESNWDLSVMRAVNFMSLLLNNKQLSPEKFSAKGYGEYQPAVPNTSKENRAKNRRVEVLILPNYDLNIES